jgi:hypothetical protein
MCVGAWSPLGYVKMSDVKAVASLPELEGDEMEPDNDWDIIEID